MKKNIINYIKSYSLLDIVMASLVALSCFLFIDFFGNTFPTPWDDESYFVLQAMNLEKYGTLYTPELLSDRILMWMQPGYMIFLSFFIKFFGFDLEVVRSISFLLYVASIFVTFCVFKSNCKVSTAILWTIVFMLPSSFVAGNIARMESLILLLVLIAIYCILVKRFVLALALIIISGLVHFNGLYLLLPLTVALIFDYKLSILKIRNASNFDWFLVIFSLFLVLLYFYFVLENYEAFVNDMHYQFERKLSRDSLIYSKLAIVLLSIGFIVSTYFYVKRSFESFVAGVSGFCLLLIFFNGQEMWYAVFRNFGLGFISYSILLSFNSLKQQVFVLIVFCTISVYLGMNFLSMRPSFVSEEYIDNSFKNNLKNELFNLSQSEQIPLTISFNTTGVDLIFYDFLVSNGYKVIHRLPQGIAAPRSVDVCVHISRAYDPAWLADLEFNAIPDASMCRIGVLMSDSNETLRWLR